MAPTIELTLESIADKALFGAFRARIDEGLGPWGGVRYVFVAGGPDPTHGCDVGAGLERGIASLVAQRAYFENLASAFDPDGFLRTHAAELGPRLGVEYAVGFRVLKV